jgi:hypothetical protein
MNRSMSQLSPELWISNPTKKSILEVFWECYIELFPEWTSPSNQTAKIIRNHNWTLGPVLYDPDLTWVHLVVTQDDIYPFSTT